MKKIFALLLILFCFTKSKSQNYVTIPDTNFVTWLQANVPSAMNGNQMDTTSLAVTTATNVDLYYKFITDLDGIQYFKALKNLDCSTNNLTTLNNLPNTIIYLKCDFNQLSYLSNIPPYLETLICSNNELTSLPLLPNTLKILVCNKTFPPFLSSITNFPTQLDSLEINGHGLSSIPPLPIGLKKLSYSKNYIFNFPILPPTLLYLNCSGNSITGITPVFPNSLLTLNCSSNGISSISSIPPNLTYLQCGVNNLVSLPVFPLSLKFFDCQVNHVTSLPTLPSNLEYLSCFQNQLTSLPLLPNGLKFLNCSTNVISILPILPNSLSELNANNNYITSLPIIPPNIYNLSVRYNLLDSIPMLPNTIDYLDISHNNISQIPSIPYNITRFNCSSNHLTHLPPIPNSVYGLDCSYNQLTQLPNLPPFLFSLTCNNNNINCFPSIPSSIVDIHILNNPFSCLPNHIPYMDATTLAYPICVQSNSLTNPNNCQTFQGIQGSIYCDSDSNCIKTFDLNANNIKVKLYNASNILLSSSNSFGNGDFNFTPPQGNYNVVIDTVNQPYKVLCSYPGTDTIAILTNSITTVSNLNFAVNCKPGFDVGVQSIINSGLSFPGQTHTVTLVAGDMSRWYNMRCAFGISGVVSFSVNGPVTYVSPVIGSITPVIQGNVYSYTISDFAMINNNSDFKLIFKTDTTAQSGDPICISASVTPTFGDNNITNNTATYCYNVSNSYDPNKKEVYPINVLPGFNDWFTYTIHFQNTGNAPAINIRLLDTLDSKLDLNSFQIINYSHFNQMDLTGNILNIRFPNINLPDSTSNMVDSQGFVQYRIKPIPNLPLGTIIYNTANIYFDFNAPIITNTTINEFMQIVSVNELNSKNNTIIYPNPTTGLFSIETSYNELIKIQLYDMKGALVFEKQTDAIKTTIDVNYLLAGIYNLKLSNEKMTVNKKLVIVK